MASKKADKYDLLIESAMAVFAEKGFHQTKIKDITDNASVAAGTFYIYFKNKDDLITAIFKKYAHTVLEKLEKIAHSNLDAKTRIEQYIKTNLDGIYENKAFFKIHFEHTHANKANHPIKNFKDIIDRYYACAEKIISDGIKNGEFDKNIDLVVAVRCLRGMTILPLFDFMLLHPELEPDKDVLYGTIIQLFLKGITNA